jgi:hypothetical protein
MPGKVEENWLDKTKIIVQVGLPTAILCLSPPTSIQYGGGFGPIRGTPFAGPAGPLGGKAGGYTGLRLPPKSWVPSSSELSAKTPFPFSSLTENLLSERSNPTSMPAPIEVKNLVFWRIAQLIESMYLLERGERRVPCSARGRKDRYCM